MDFKEKLNVFPTIETSKIRLRKLRIEDAEDLVAYYSNEKVYRYLDWYGPENLEEGTEAIERWNRGFEEGWIIRFAIAEKESDRIIGTIFLSEFEGRRAEIGYELSQNYWRRGIMSEAVQVVLKLGFEKLKLSRIQAFVCDENRPSRDMLKKFGFEEEGFLRQYECHGVTGECKDMWIYGLLNRDI